MLIKDRIRNNCIQLIISVWTCNGELMCAPDRKVETIVIEVAAWTRGM